MSMYRKIPAEVEARQWDASKGFRDACELAQWCNGDFYYDGHVGQVEKPYYWGIAFLGNGLNYYARPGQYILKHADGTFSKMNVDRFEATYEKSTK